MKLGKNQTIIFVLIGIATTTFYYGNKIISTSSGTFSDGIQVGFLMAITLICSLSILFLWLRMLYLNWKVRQKNV